MHAGGSVVWASPHLSGAGRLPTRHGALSPRWRREAKLYAYPLCLIPYACPALPCPGRRFRLDGVKRDPRTQAADGVIPFTPAGPEFFRHQILLTKLIPGNAYNFPNDSLTMAEQVGGEWGVAGAYPELCERDACKRSCLSRACGISV